MACNGTCTTEPAPRLFISNKSLLNQKFLKTKALSRKSYMYMYVYRAFIVQWFIGNTEACQRSKVSVLDFIVPVLDFIVTGASMVHKHILFLSCNSQTIQIPKAHFWHHISSFVLAKFKDIYKVASYERSFSFTFSSNPSLPLTRPYRTDLRLT